MTPGLWMAHLRFHFYRHGWAAVAALLLAGLAVAIQLFGVQPLRARTVELHKVLAAVRPAALKVPSREEIQLRDIAGFYAALPSAGGAGGGLDAVAKIHGAAGTHGVSLSHGEYRLVRDGSARLWRYQITLPARASYPHLRAWLAETLSAVPSASLDELSLRRADSGSDVVEALVRLTLYTRAD